MRKADWGAPVIWGRVLGQFWVDHRPLTGVEVVLQPTVVGLLPTAVGS